MNTIATLLSQLDLPPAAKKILVKNRIRSVEQLCAMTELQLYKLPGMWQQPYEQIRKALNQHGYVLADSAPISSLALPEEATSKLVEAGINFVDVLCTRTQAEVASIVGESNLRRIEHVLDNVNRKLTGSEPIYHLRLSWKVKQSLRAHGIHTVAELCAKTAEELLLPPQYMPDMNTLTSEGIEEIRKELTQRRLFRLALAGSTHIDQLNLSRSIKDVLLNEELAFIEMLCSMTERELLRVHSVGPRKLNEIKRALATRGLALLIEFEQPPEVAQLNLSAWILTSLKHASIQSIEELSMMTDAELLEVPGLGRERLNQIKAALASYQQALPRSQRC